MARVRNPITIHGATEEFAMIVGAVEEARDNVRNWLVDKWRALWWLLFAMVVWLTMPIWIWFTGRIWDFIMDDDGNVGWAINSGGDDASTANDDYSKRRLKYDSPAAQVAGNMIEELMGMPFFEAAEAIRSKK